VQGTRQWARVLDYYVQNPIKAGGGTIMMGPHQVPGGQWIVQCKDPQDAYFALVSRKR